MRQFATVFFLATLASACGPAPRPTSEGPAPTEVASVVEMPTSPPPSAAPAPTPTAPAAPSPEESRPRSILNERTSDIRDAQAEQGKGGVVTPPKIVSKDPIRIMGNAYVSIVGQASVLKIKHALDIFKAQNERFPNDTQEFMEQVIRANNIALPRLPYYQEYAYDAQTHQLVIMEYPARKEARERELEKQ